MMGLMNQQTTQGPAVTTLGLTTLLAAFDGYATFLTFLLSLAATTVIIANFVIKQKRDAREEQRAAREEQRAIEAHKKVMGTNNAN